MSDPIGGVWGLKVGDFQPTNYLATVAGVQLALDDCEAAGGGTVFVDSGSNIPILTTSVKIPNRVRLVGTGDHTSVPTFAASALTNVTAMVENKSQDGTQQYAYVENIQIWGNKGSGAVVGAGLRLKAVYAGSAVRNSLIWACSGNGLVLDGGESPVRGIGQMTLDNVTVTTCDDDNILITGAADHICGYQITSESVAAGKAQMKITRGSSGTASSRHQFYGFHMEGTAACDGIILHECSGCVLDGIVFDGSTANNVVKITGSTTGSDGAFAAAGHTLRNIQGNLATIIDDQVAGVTVGNSQGRFVRWYQSPVCSTTLDNAQCVGLQSQQEGPSIVSAATITPGNGNLFLVTGTTTITSVTAAARDKGRVITLRFNNALTVTDGSNLVMNGSMSTVSGDTLTLICDGTNWNEVARSNQGDLVLAGSLFQLRASVASAATMALGAGNIFSVTGTTTINSITPATGGRVIHLKFNAACTLSHNAGGTGNVFLAGGANFHAIDTNAVTLYSDGTNWFELSRQTFFRGRGTDIASAATIAIPSFGDVFHVTGTTNITNGITVNSIDAGRTVTLIFDSTPTLSDTGTSVLAGDLVATAADTITLKCDGTNWYEIGRSIN